MEDWDTEHRDPPERGEGAALPCSGKVGRKTGGDSEVIGLVIGSGEVFYFEVLLSAESEQEAAGLEV